MLTGALIFALTSLLVVTTSGADRGTVPPGEFVAVCDRKDLVLGHSYTPGCGMR